VSAFDEFQSLLSRMNAVYAHTSGYDSVSVSATTVKAGSHPNVIPNRCDATVDVRIPPRLSVKEVVSRLKGAAKGLAEGTRLTMAFTDPIEAYETPGGSLLARSLRRSIIRTLKSRPVSTVKTGTGDMNIFGSTTSADCVTYGPGRPEVAHSNLEFIEISDYERSIDVLSGAIGEFGELLRSESQSR
jgi:LysW-gamma-L-lysine carboxypeptidase